MIGTWTLQNCNVFLRQVVLMGVWSMNASSNHILVLTMYSIRLLKSWGSHFYSPLGYATGWSNEKVLVAMVGGDARGDGNGHLFNDFWWCTGKVSRIESLLCSWGYAASS